METSTKAHKNQGHEVRWSEEKINTFNNFRNEIRDPDCFAGKTTAILLKPLILKHAVKGDKLLDIGFGGGHLLKILSQDLSCYGVDIAISSVRRMQEDNIKVALGSIEEIPFDMRFGVITLTDVLEHLTDRQLQIGLENVKKHLCDLGKLIATTPYNEDLSNAKVICPDCGAIFHRNGHQRSFNERALRDLLESHGYQIVELGRLDFNSMEHGFSLLAIILYRMLTFRPTARLTNTMYAVARCRPISKDSSKERIPECLST